MKCPLFILADRRVQMGEETEIGDCIKEGCAWYIETQGECAVKQLSLSLGFISLDTTQLLEKKG